MQMKFSTREDIEAPIDYVFSRASDFAGFERQALRRGAQVARLGGEGAVDVGTTWDIAFKFRNKDRKMRAVLQQLDDPSLIQIDTDSAGLGSVAKVELVSLSPKRTRLAVSIEISPKSLSARLLVQSLRLAKSNISKRFESRVRDFATTTEDEYRKVQ
jgi:hypothetical protein